VPATGAPRIVTTWQPTATTIWPDTLTAPVLSSGGEDTW
jgi:hypothetical protein